ncbi:MAG: hypothetical protein R3C05_06350 [Pirellulaceae bacterium]
MSSKTVRSQSFPLRSLSREPPTVGIPLLPSELSNVQVPSFAGVFLYMTSPVRALCESKVDGTVFAIRWAQQFWLFAVWIFPAGYVMRLSALSVAGRERMGTLETWKMVFQRYASFLSGTLLTFGFALLCLSYFLILGWIDRIPTIGHLLAIVGSIVGLPVLFIAGVLLFGTLLSFPLMWSSVVVESYADGFDAASRGFEYVIQRPFRFAAYVIMVTLLTIVIANFASGVTSIGLAFVNNAFAAGTSSGKGLPTGIESLVRMIPVALAFNLFWAFAAGIYLLLRRDANHQDVEDVWEPALPAGDPLPELNITPAKTETP